jgi:hypothetical protein
MEQEAGDLQQFTEGLQPEDRSLPAVHNLDSYLALAGATVSAEGLLRAERSTSAPPGFEVVEVASALLAAALAAFGSISSSVGAWAAFATTGGGALAVM